MKGFIRDYTNNSFIVTSSIKRIRPIKNPISKELPEHVTESEVQFQGTDKFEWLRLDKRDVEDYLRGRTELKEFTEFIKTLVNIKKEEKTNG